MQTERGDSHTLATIFMVVITILLAAMVLLLFYIPSLDMGSAPPPLFTVRTVHHTDELTGALNYDSRLVFYHNGSVNYKNDDLSAMVYRNGGEWSCPVETLNGEHFVPSHHYKIQWMGGSGCSGMLFTPGEQVVIDFKDGTFHPGDIVRLEVNDRKSGKCISTHTYRIP